jgi:hypothetical protein
METVLSAGRWMGLLVSSPAILSVPAARVDLWSSVSDPARIRSLSALSTSFLLSLCFFLLGQILNVVKYPISHSFGSLETDMT